MTTNASRAPVDFDAFKRELQPSLPEAAPPMSDASQYDAGKPDPLAELARIVGQDDPFRALLESRGSARPAGRVEPSLQEPASARHDVAASPADAFDRYLASVEQSHQSGDHPEPAAFASREERSIKPAGRRKLVQVGAGLGVMILCVSGALAWRGLHGGASGNGPVTVLADKSPLKVAPEKSDGVDIPDQNKQIYERNAKDNQIKVVNREEQPVDVVQAARAMGREGGSPTPTQGGTTPGGGLLTDSLGEPRRIRTVSVKPDTPPPAVSQPAPQQAAPSTPEPTPEQHASVSPIPTMTLPDEGESTATPASSTPKPAATGNRAASAKPMSTPAAMPIVEASAAEEPAAKPVPPRRTQRRVASVAPEAGLPAAEPETTAAPAANTAVGGFAVQLGVRNSEADARSALQQMQAKHSQLSDKPALIRQAELNGKSFYRVRVGPLGKAEATSLCASLKDAGSACFVAAN